MADSKTPLESKTIKYQVISAMIVVLIGGFTALNDIIPANYVIIALLVLKVIDAGINTYLRLITDQPIQRNP